MIPIILIIIAVILNALQDSIAFTKGNQTLYELWHILKGLQLYGLCFYIFIQAGFTWYLFFALAIALGGIWEFVYRIARANEFYRLDNSISISFIRKIWGIKRW